MGKYSIGDSQHFKPCPGLPCLACEEGEEGRGPMTIAQQSASASVLFFSCRGTSYFHGLPYVVQLYAVWCILCTSFMPELVPSSGKESFCLKGGPCSS